MEEKKGLERYQIIEKLGEGGMGEVYLAEDLNLKRRVALKKAFESKDAEILKIAEKEAQTLANLKHPNLPTVYDYFVEENVQYIVMEYISGKNLDEIMKHNPLYFTDEKNAEIMQTMLDVLEYLHQHEPPIIHRDIKPKNIKISENGILSLLDFGLVKNAGLNSKDGTVLTLSKSKFFGYSQNYSPLEQVKGEQTFVEADVYSLCATLYFLYTKTVPIDSLDRADIRSKGQSDPLIPIQILNQNIAQRVSEMIMSGTELHKENRPQSIAELRQILDGGATQSPRYEQNFQYTNEPQNSSRFQVNFNDKQKSDESNNNESDHLQNLPKRKKSWLVYAVLTTLLLVLLGFYLYENNLYNQNKAIIDRLEKSAVDDFNSIETEWSNYEEAAKKSSYFKWGLNDVKDKIQKKIDEYANHKIEKYRTSGSTVGKSDEWKKPQKLLERILSTDINNKNIQSKIAYLKGQQDFSIAFGKGADKTSLLTSARKYYEEAINLNPKFGDPYFMIAQTYIYGKSRDYSKAIENIDLAVNNSFPFDKRTKAVKADCLQALADATVKREKTKLLARNINSDHDAHEFLGEFVESLKTIREKYVAAKTLYEEAKGFGTVDKSLTAINSRLAKLEEGIDTVSKLHLLADVVKIAQEESEF